MEMERLGWKVSACMCVCVRVWKNRVAADERSQWSAAGSCPLFSAEMPERTSHETVSEAQNKIKIIHISVNVMMLSSYLTETLLSSLTVSPLLRVLRHPEMKTSHRRTTALFLSKDDGILKTSWFSRLFNTKPRLIRPFLPTCCSPWWCGTKRWEAFGGRMNIRKMLINVFKLASNCCLCL